eukprot:2597376-Amphidinium_carterae.4
MSFSCASFVPDEHTGEFVEVAMPTEEQPFSPEPGPEEPEDDCAHATTSAVSAESKDVVAPELPKDDQI